MRDNLRDIYMKKGHGFVLVYSIIAESTFFDIPDLCDNILRVKDANKVPTVIVGNKLDLSNRRVITTEQGQTLATKFGAVFFEASAKVGTNVDQIFHELIRQISLTLVIERQDGKGKSQCFLL